MLLQFHQILAEKQLGGMQVRDRRQMEKFTNRRPNLISGIINERQFKVVYDEFDSGKTSVVAAADQSIYFRKSRAGLVDGVPIDVFKLM